MLALSRLVGTVGRSYIGYMDAHLTLIQVVVLLLSCKEKWKWFSLFCSEGCVAPLSRERETGTEQKWYSVHLEGLPMKWASFVNTISVLSLECGHRHLTTRKGYQICSKRTDWPIASMCLLLNLTSVSFCLSQWYMNNLSVICYTVLIKWAHQNCLWF